MQLTADAFIPPFPARLDGWRSPYRVFFGESQRNILHGWANEFFETWHRRQQVFGLTFHLINSPAAVGHVLLENKANYVRPGLAQRILVPFVGNGLLTAEGEGWQKQRKVVAPTFAPGAVAALSDIIGSVARRQTTGWATADAVLDMAAEATSATMAVIADALFSGDPRLTSASAHGHIDSVLKTLAAPRLTNVLNLPPLNITGMRRREARSRGYLRQSLEAMVDERGPTGGPDDFFGGLIRALHAQFPPEQARQITIDNAITFYVAGHETTAVALTWTIYLLAAQPALQEAARREAIAALDGDLAELPESTPLLRRIIDEAMRLYPPITRIDRQAVAADEIGHIAINKGDIVTFLPFALHRHKELWVCPDGFDAERFAPENRAKLHRYQYIPFGAGPRICVGARFAIVEAQIILAHWLAARTFDVLPGHQLEFIGTAVLRPKGGLPISVKRIR